MPEVQKGQSLEDYLKICIPYIIKNEGLEQKHAVAKCHGIYEQHKKNHTKAQTEEWAFGFLSPDCEAAKALVETHDDKK